jgi:hypothetical protein
MKKYKTISISCKAKDLLDEIMRLNPMLKKGAYVENLLQQEYQKMKESK